MLVIDSSSDSGTDNENEMSFDQQPSKPESDDDDCLIVESNTTQDAQQDENSSDDEERKFHVSKRSSTSIKIPLWCCPKDNDNSNRNIPFPQKIQACLQPHQVDGIRKYW